MLNTNHPDDERLAALSSRDDDATGDAFLTSHLASCGRCAEVVSELATLRSSLAELPDLEPSRPLRLLPPVADAQATDGLAAWVRRLFAPVVTAGAALALVGVVGTALPQLDGMAASGGADSLEAATGEGSPEADGFTYEAASSDAAAPAAGAGAASASSDDGVLDETAQTREAEAEAEQQAAELPAERSPWPMVLFTGVALVVAAGVLRWIVVPRAG